MNVRTWALVLTSVFMHPPPPATHTSAFFFFFGLLSGSYLHSLLETQFCSSPWFYEVPPIIILNPPLPKPAQVDFYHMQLKTISKYTLSQFIFVLWYFNICKI